MDIMRETLIGLDAISQSMADKDAKIKRQHMTIVRQGEIIRQLSEALDSAKNLAAKSFRVERK